MPELPEVETVRQGLSAQLAPRARFEGVVRSAHKLRFRFPSKLKQRLSGQQLLSIERRAKYLLFLFEQDVLINHLGMTGSWRKIDSLSLQNHDHVILQFENNQNLVYRDPRRFGYFDISTKEGLFSTRWFEHLGPEPLESEHFTARYLFEASRRRTGPIKTFIMNQEIVVGVGNIYASEALFMAKIHPLRPASSLSLQDCKSLVQAIRKILHRAIKEGGTTIRDFVALGGELGAYSQSLSVYGRAGAACPICYHPIQSLRLAGRSTFSCLKCQK